MKITLDIPDAFVSTLIVALNSTGFQALALAVEDEQERTREPFILSDEQKQAMKARYEALKARREQAK